MLTENNLVVEWFYIVNIISLHFECFFLDILLEKYFRYVIS